MADNEKEILLKVKADTSGAETSIKDLKENISDLKNKAEETRNSFGVDSTQFKNANAELKTMQGHLGGVDGALKNINPKNTLQPLVDISTQANTAIKGSTLSMKGLTLATELGKDMFSQFKGVIAGAGFGLLIIAVGYLIENFGKWKDAIFGTNEAQELLNATLKEGRDGFINATTEVDKLKIAIDEAKKGIVSQDSVVKLFNETMGKTTGLLTNFKDVENTVTKNGDKYIEMMYKRAAANIALGKAAQAAFEIQTLMNEGATTSFWDITDPITKQKNLIAQQQKLKAANDKIAKDFFKQVDEIAKSITTPSPTKTEKTTSTGTTKTKDLTGENLNKKIAEDNYLFTLNENEKLLELERKKHAENLAILKKYNQDSKEEMIRHNREVEIITTKVMNDRTQVSNADMQQQLSSETKLGADKLDVITKASQAYIEPIIKIGVDQKKNAKDISDKEKELSSTTKEAKISDLEAVANVTNALTDLAGQNTVAGKAFAIATTTIDTWLGAQKAFNSQLTPGDPTAPFRAYAAAASAVIAGLANVKRIVSVQVPHTKGGSGAGSTTSIAPPQINSTMLNPELTAVKDVRVTNSSDTVVRAYITDKDISDNQSKQEFLNKLSNF